MFGIRAPLQYPRGANPFGGSFAAQGATFKAALQAGYTGAAVYGSVAKGAIAKFFAPIVESHCIAFYTGGLKEGASVPLNGIANLIESWLLKYDLKSVMDGAPVNDTIILPQYATRDANGVYRIVVASGIAPGGGTAVSGSPRVRTALV